LLVGKRENRGEAAIHMLFMRMDLAVVWINDGCQVVAAQLARRWRPACVPPSPARYTLEIAAERLAEFKTGDRLKFENTSLG